MWEFTQQLRFLLLTEVIMDADEEALFAVSTLSPRQEESPLLVFHGKTQPPRRHAQERPIASAL
jgi:hypothetical protein